MPSRPTVSEPAVIFLIGAVQFVNILDFVMVMPLGPFFTEGLKIDPSYIGVVAGSYTGAAGVAGLMGGYFLDRFDRRKALAVSMLGLVFATAAGGLAAGLPTLILARVLAGIFGGPATSIAMAIIADVIPPERRGRAMGAVMGAFSVAQIVGLPLSLMAADLIGWRAPFLGVAAMGLVVVVGAVFFLPPIREHLEKGTRPVHPVGIWELLRHREVQLSYLMSAFVMMGGFVVIPFIPEYVVENLGHPRNQLWILYACGGVVSLVTLRFAGRMVDRYGSFRVGSIGAVLAIILTYMGFVNYPHWMPIYVLFMGFMLAMGLRNVSYNTLTSKVPELSTRARFMSLQSAISHLSSSVASGVIGYALVKTLPDGKLAGMASVAWVSIGLALAVPPMLFIVERHVRQRAAARAAAGAQAPAPGGTLAPQVSTTQR
jgi:predicted MFS family arabinose efflux permease